MISKIVAILILSVPLLGAPQSQWTIPQRTGATASSGGGAAPTYIASAVNTASGFGISSPLTMSYTPSGPGHALYICGSVGVGTITGITDSTGALTTVFSPVSWNALSGGGQFACSMQSSASAGAHTVSMAMGSSPGYGILYVFELSSSSTFGSVDTSSVGSSSANPIPCGSVTTSANSIVLAFGEVFDGGVTLTVGSGPPSFILPTPTGTGFIFAGMEYSGATTATTYTISSGFVPSGTLDYFFCAAVEAKP